MKREVKIGIFAVAIICCSWAGIRFLSGIDIFSRNMDYYARYQTISGINSASPVMIQGVKVGTVTDIILDPTKSDKVTVKLSVKKRYRIPSNSSALIYSPGLMSSMAIGLELGDSATYLKSGDAIATKVEEGLMDMAADKLVTLVDQIGGITEQLGTTLDSVNALLADNNQNINGTIENLSQIAEQISDLLASQQGNLESTMEGIATLSTTLGQNSENFDSIIENLTLISQTLCDEQLAQSLSATVSELNTTLGKINAAEGSAGLLLNDEQLYQNLTAVGSSLNELLLDMQANPKRYVHFSLFGAKDKSE